MTKYSALQFIKDWIRGFLLLLMFITFVLFLIWIVTYFPTEIFISILKWGAGILAIILIPWLIGFKPEKYL